jgi:hypothetical protein
MVYGRWAPQGALAAHHILRIGVVADPDHNGRAAPYCTVHIAACFRCIMATAAVPDLELMTHSLDARRAASPLHTPKRRSLAPRGVQIHKHLGEQWDEQTSALRRPAIPIRFVLLPAVSVRRDTLL